MDLGWNPAATAHAPELLARVQELRVQVAATQARLLAGWRPGLELRGFLASAANLAAYIALRRHDLCTLERRLAAVGLAALGRPAGHVMATTGAGRPARKRRWTRPGGGARRGSPWTASGWRSLEPGDRVLLRDLKGRKRSLAVEARLTEHEVATVCSDDACIARGTELEHEPRGRRKGGKTRTGPLLAPAVEIEVQPGTALLLTREGVPGGPERRDKRGRVVEPAHIACTEPAVFRFLEAGHTLWIDHGRIGGLVERVDKHGARLRITRARPEGERIAADQSIHLPDARVDLPALCERDLVPLDFACKHADLVGTWVKGTEDVDRLADALRERGARHLGVIAWIETRQAVLNLPDIMAHCAGRHPFGVVIARSDLAVELGCEQLPAVEQQILRLCEAAHVPVLWSTRLLETLVRRDLPFRTEIVDAAIAERAECVLLKEGPYILQALAQLAALLTRTQAPLLEDSARSRAVQW